MEFAPLGPANNAGCASPQPNTKEAPYPEAPLLWQPVIDRLLSLLESDALARLFGPAESGMRIEDQLHALPDRRLPCFGPPGFEIETQALDFIGRGAAAIGMEHAVEQDEALLVHIGQLRFNPVLFAFGELTRVDDVTLDHGVFVALSRR